MKNKWKIIEKSHLPLNKNMVEYELTVLINNFGKILDPTVYPEYNELVDKIYNFLKNM